MPNAPLPNEHHKRLHRFIGNWLGDEKLSPSAWGPGGTATGHFAMRSDERGFFIIQDYSEEKDGKSVFEGHGIVGWDDSKKKYLWYWVDSMGFMPGAPSEGTWEGDLLVFNAQDATGQKCARYSYQFTGENSFIFKIQNSPDGGKSWSPMMEGTFLRDA